MLSRFANCAERVVPAVALAIILSVSYAVAGNARAADPIDTIEPSSTECLCIGTVAVTFGHGYRHLVGTGLPRAGVESSITSHVRANPIYSVGSFWQRTYYYGNGWYIKYHAYRTNLTTVHVGTYYPIR